VIGSRLGDGTAKAMNDRKKSAVTARSGATDVERTPNPIDVHVGARVRRFRKQMNVSQEKLAEALGLTFQQVQKYERGANRISASKLYEIACTLHRSISEFFEGLSDPSQGRGEGFAEPGGVQFINELLMTNEGMDLAALFPKIKRARVRRRVVDLVRALVEEEEAESGSS